MAQEVIEVVEREVEVIEILERGLMGMTGPVGPQANINYIVVSSSQTVSNRQMIAADTSGGSFTLTLPSNPAAGDAIDIFDYSDTFDTNPLTIARNGQNIEGLGDDLVANVEGAYFTLIFTGASRGWQVVPRYGVSGLQNVLTTEGDLLYRGASAETRLGIGSAGQVLKVNSGATAPEWGALPDSIDDYTVVTTSQTIVNGARIAADTSSAAFTLTLPATPANGETVYILDFAQTFDTNNLTLARNGSLIEGSADDMVCNVEGSSFKMVYTGSANGGWQMIPFFGVAGVASVSGTAPIVSSGGATPAISITAATTSAAGSMSSADKTKLNGIAEGAEVNVNADWDAVSGDAQILNKPATFTPSSHTHGSITNDGKIGATAGLPVVTTTAGAITTLALGTANQVLRVNAGETGVEFGAGFDAASPPAIGNATPNTGAFTTLTANNGTLTASAPALTLLQTWDATAQAFHLCTIGITNSTPWTASAASSTLFRVQFGGANAFSVGHTGNTTAAGFLVAGSFATNGTLQLSSNVNFGAGTSQTGDIWTSSALKLRLWNLGSPSSATNFERANLRWDSNEFIIDVSNGGTGTLRGIKLGSATTSLLGFYGVTPVDQPALTADLLDSLQEIGLIASGSGDTPLNLSGGTLTAGNLILTDNDGPQTATFDAQSKLTGDRTYDLPDASGTLALTSDIPSVSKTYAVFTATDNQPPASSYATLDTRNSIAVLDFDDATDESAVFLGIIPEAASLGSGLKIRLHWMATTATSNNCVWDVSLERMTTDLDSDSFDTIASATAAANGTSGILTVTEITLTTIDSVTAGDGFRLKVTRDADNGSDDMSGDAELIAVEVRSAA